MQKKYQLSSPSTHFYQFQPTSPIYQPLFTNEKSRPLDGSSFQNPQWHGHNYSSNFDEVPVRRLLVRGLTKFKYFFLTWNTQEFICAFGGRAVGLHWVVLNTLNHQFLSSKGFFGRKVKHRSFQAIPHVLFNVMEGEIEKVLMTVQTSLEQSEDK